MKSRGTEGVSEQRVEKCAPKQPGPLCGHGSPMWPLHGRRSSEDKRGLLRMWDSISVPQSLCPLPTWMAISGGKLETTTYVTRASMGHVPKDILLCPSPISSMSSGISDQMNTRGQGLLEVFRGWPLHTEVQSLSGIQANLWKEGLMRIFQVSPC